MSFSHETENKIQRLSSKIIDATSKIHAYAIAGSALYVPTVSAIDSLSSAPTSTAIGFIGYSAAAYLIPKMTTGMGPYEILQNYVSRNPIKILDMAESKRRVTPIVRDDFGLDPLDRKPVDYILKRAKLMTMKEKASLFNLLEARSANNSKEDGQTFFPEIKNQLIQMIEAPYSSMDSFDKRAWKNAIELSRSKDFPKWELSEDATNDPESKPKSSDRKFSQKYANKMREVSAQEHSLEKAKNLIGDAVSMYPKKHANRFPSMNHNIAIESGSIIPPSFLLEKLIKKEGPSVRQHVIEAINGTGELSAEDLGVDQKTLSGLRDGFEKVLAYPELFAITDNENRHTIKDISNDFKAERKSAKEAFLQRQLGEEPQAIKSEMPRI